jgi:hypothetical protein
MRRERRRPSNRGFSPRERMKNEQAKGSSFTSFVVRRNREEMCRAHKLVIVANVKRRARRNGKKWVVWGFAERRKVDESDGRPCFFCRLPSGAGMIS